MLHRIDEYKEEFKDSKGVIRIRKSKKDRQYIGQTKKDRQYIGQTKKDRQYIGQTKKEKRTNSDIQNIHKILLYHSL